MEEIKEKNNKLIEAEDMPVVYIENLEGNAPGLVLCDHASNRIPNKLKNLGLSQEDRLKHIAYDPGTEGLGKYIAKALDMPLILAGYSRLVIDLNRSVDSEGSILETSDHIEIPGNKNITEEERKARVEDLYVPYHNEIEAQRKRIEAKTGQPPVLLSIHSFTPQMDEVNRPWQISILWDEDDYIAEPLMENLRKNNPDLCIGDNKPYSLRGDQTYSNTIKIHAQEKGLDFVFVEFRQDMVDTPDKVKKMAKIFLESLKPVLENRKLEQK